MDVRSIAFCKEDYFQCIYCNYLLQKKNFNYLDHSCLQDVDFSREEICSDSDNYIFKIDKHSTGSTEKDSENRSIQDSPIDIDERLIEAVRSRPCLWDISSPVKSRSSLNILEAWKEVSHELDDMFDIEYVKRRWRNLRDSFTRAKRKINAYHPSGSAGSSNSGDMKKDSFRFYNQMLFLNECVASRPSVSNITKSTPEGLSSRDESEAGPSNEFKKRKKNSDSDFQKELVEILKQPVPQRELDGVDGFLLQVGEVLRKLPYGERRKVQQQISNLLFQVEEKCGLV